MRKKLIAPSILSADFANIQLELERLQLAGADMAHVDVMDGHFVPNLTIGAPVVRAMKKVTRLPLDVHLMIEKPEKYIPDFIKAGADWITIHVESTDKVEECIATIKAANVKAGITLRPGTDLEAVLPYLSKVDLVLVMTVEPGFGGQSFMKEQVDKITRLRKEIDSQKLSTLIEVDGGVNDQTLTYLADADILVAGSYIFKQDYSKAIRSLRRKL